MVGDGPSIRANLDKPFKRVCEDVREARHGHGVTFPQYDFPVHMNDRHSEQAMYCIRLMNKYSCMEKEVLSAISKLLRGYEIEGYGRVNFFAVLRFFMAMTMRADTNNCLPREITKSICLLTMQCTRLDFAEGNSDEFYKEFMDSALREPKLIQAHPRPQAQALDKKRITSPIENRPPASPIIDTSKRNNPSKEKLNKDQSDDDCTLF